VAGQCRPDLALMDVGLAGEMDGIEAAGLIWEQFGIPVIYLSSSSDRDTVSRAASTEAYGYLQKPIQSRELSSAIQIALSKHEAERNLVESKNWLETTMRCIADAVIAADSLGMVKFINPAAEALTGWRQREAVGQDLLEVFQVLDCDTRAPGECEVTRIIRGDDSARETRPGVLVSRSGVETIVEETAAAIINERGDIAGVVLVFRPRASR